MLHANACGFVHRFGANACPHTTANFIELEPIDVVLFITHVTVRTEPLYLPYQIAAIALYPVRSVVIMEGMLSTGDHTFLESSTGFFPMYLLPPLLTCVSLAPKPARMG